MRFELLKNPDGGTYLKRKGTDQMEIDTIATHDAEQIRRLVDNGEPLSTTAAGLGYTPSEALHLLDHAANHPDILVGWWKEYN